MIVSALLDLVEDFEGLSQKEQVKLMAFFHCTEYSKEFFSTSDIKAEFSKHSIQEPSNVSSEISKLKKNKPAIILQNTNGLSFQRKALKELEETYLGNEHKKQTSSTLRALLGKIEGNEQKKFLEEAIHCFEIKSYRASIIMVWLLTIDVLQEVALQPSNLGNFKTAILAHGKYKKVFINKKEDFSEINESTFIELLKSAKIITNDTRKILDEKLGTRNTCSHPNSISIEEYKVIDFIQDLSVNIINKYQK